MLPMTINRLSRAKRGFLLLFLLLLLAGQLPAAPSRLARGRPTNFPASQPPLTMGEAINKAGRQRMLSQRIAKAYAMVGAKHVLSARIQLKKAVDLFQKQLNELAAFAKTHEEKATIAQVARLWRRYRALAMQNPSRDKALDVMALSEKVLAKSHQFVLLLEQRSGTKTGRLVNISGRQRMLSQRIAKYYAYKTWGFDKPEYDEEMNKAVAEFSNALDTLKNAPQNTSEINEALAKVEQDWRTFKVSKRIKGDYIPSLVMRSMENILNQMNYITALYAALLK